MTPNITEQVVEALREKSRSSQDLAEQMDKFAMIATDVIADRDLADTARQLADLSRHASQLAAQMAEHISRYKTLVPFDIH